MPQGHKQSTNELAKIFYEFSAWETMKNSRFKPRAYELASESITALGDDVRDTWEKGGVKALKELPGIGQSIAEKIDEFFSTGKIKEYAAMKKKFPVDMWELSQIEGIGPKHIKDLYTHLKVKNLTDLKRALQKKKLRTLKGWGEKSEERIKHALGLLKKSSGRMLLGSVLPIADEIINELKTIKGVKRCVYAGSLRRMQETVGDIDLLATSSNPEAVMDAFVGLPQVQSVHEHGKTRSMVRLKIGLDADLRVVPDDVFGAALQYFTGDKRHNVLVREYAISKKMSLNEYGLFKGKKLLAAKTEAAVYKKLGMATPPPEIRIGGDEIEAAKKKKLPKLIPYGSVKGDLQVQTNWTDGNASIEEMVRAAKDAGLSYIAVTDHTKALAFIGGLDEKKYAKQRKEIEKLRKKFRGFGILKGTECDIRKDGSLDLKDNALAKLDWVGISVHSAFRLSRKEQTARVVKAMSNPHVDCLFHPTARLIGKREPIDIDMDDVIAAAKKYRVALEIDAFPDRSDLRDIHVRAAVQAGVKLVINTDAHDPLHFQFIKLGEAIARRGWASSSDILNTKSHKQLLAYLAKKR